MNKVTKLTKAIKIEVIYFTETGEIKSSYKFPQEGIIPTNLRPLGAALRDIDIAIIDGKELPTSWKVRD